MTFFADAIGRGLASARPAVGDVPIGSLYYSTDTGALERNSGSTWESVAPLSAPPSGAAGGVLSGTFPNPGFAVDMATQSELDAVAGVATAHIADTTAAHAASAIAFTPNGSIAATDVQAAIQEVRDEAVGGGGGGLVVLDEVVLAADQATVNFPSIPTSGYRNLVVKIAARASIAAVDGDIYLQFNGDTSANYDRQYHFANGANHGVGEALATATAGIGIAAGNTAVAGAIGLTSIVIPSYRSAWRKIASGDGTVKHTDATLSQSMVDTSVGWRNTAAITSILFGMVGGSNFKAGSVFTLYGEVVSSSPRTS
jgi:hypothetical protein